MSQNLMSFCFLAFLLFSCQTNQKGDENIESDKTAITAMSKARAEAFNRGDAATIAKYFTGDAKLMAPGSPVKTGTQEVEAYYAAIFNEFETSLESYYEEVEVSGDMAFGRGEAKVDLISKATGEKTTSTSKYLNILQKQSDGTWKTTHDIWNDNEE
ncbi:YybH family protein [Pararhodonellum marinum]|uniref:YybH family protein n=1 Tax=Pararhodonellum marinum TaxID=2755358 RepID=UPI00188E28F0|nr:SgcJ/EcaC family oxidoreductase [Pararhodonellum marinum]